MFRIARYVQVGNNLDFKRRRTIARVAVVACAMLCVSGGCRHFLGIDLRPDIHYVLANHHEQPSEPMFAVPMPGTNLIKRWPTRKGYEYGFLFKVPKEEPNSKKTKVQIHGATPIASGNPQRKVNESSQPKQSEINAESSEKVSTLKDTTEQPGDHQENVFTGLITLPSSE